LIIIHENQLENAIALSIQIPEFERPYEIEEYEKRLKGNHLILTAHGDETTFGFKIGYDRFSDGSFYSWMGVFPLAPSALVTFLFTCGERLLNTKLKSVKNKDLY